MPRDRSDFTTVGIRLVDLGDHWEYTPGICHLAIDLAAIGAKIAEFQQIGELRQDSRPELSAAAYRQGAILQALRTWLTGHLGEIVMFTLHKRVLADLLKPCPILVARTDRAARLTAGMFPEGIFGVRLEFDINLTTGAGTITTRTTYSESNRGPWENTPPPELH